ncbi:DUF5336 domain-containing protein [Tsukamurella soli]|uniref:DUF5336 domain-containing protein n=1 Tax=Tsukamurella soli TaxID=644556 RepID=UPI00361BA52A
MDLGRILSIAVAAAGVITFLTGFLEFFSQTESSALISITRTANGFQTPLLTALGLVLAAGVSGGLSLVSRNHTGRTPAAGLAVAGFLTLLFGSFEISGASFGLWIALVFALLTAGAAVGLVLVEAGIVGGPAASAASSTGADASATTVAGSSSAGGQQWPGYGQSGAAQSGAGGQSTGAQSGGTHSGAPQTSASSYGYGAAAEQPAASQAGQSSGGQGYGGYQGQYTGQPQAGQTPSSPSQSGPAASSSYSPSYGASQSSAGQQGASPSGQSGYGSAPSAGSGATPSENPYDEKTTAFRPSGGTSSTGQGSSDTRDSGPTQSS